MNKKAFLLFEVLVSVAFIATALIVITRSYSASKNSIRKSSELVETSILLENKMFEFEEAGQTEELDAGGDFGEGSLYAWQIKSSKAEGINNVNMVQLDVFKEKYPDRTRYQIVTYLKNKQEEEKPKTP